MFAGKVGSKHQIPACTALSDEDPATAAVVLCYFTPNFDFLVDMPRMSVIQGGRAYTAASSGD